MKQQISTAIFVLAFAGIAFSQESAETQSKPPRHSAPTPIHLPPPTWEPLPGATQRTSVGTLNKRKLRDLPETAFAFPHIRKEPLVDAAHVRSAIARFSEVKDVTDDDRDLAFANIKKAALFFGVHLREKDWRPGMQNSAGGP
jgi:hypothetical protein